MNFDSKKKLIIGVVLTACLVIGFIIYSVVEYREYNTNDLADILLGESINDSDNDLIQKSESKANLNTNEEDTNSIVEEEIPKIAIHIIGEVKNEGLIYLPEGSRVADAIQEAGGETKEADLSQVNLAYELQDGQKLYIPNKNEKIEVYIINENGNNGVESEELEEGGKKKVNINTATQNELDELPGIGPAIAQRIIEYREENGNFQKIEDLQNVKGIGDAKYEEIKESVTVWKKINKKVEIH